MADKVTKSMLLHINGQLREDVGYLRAQIKGKEDIIHLMSSFQQHTSTIVVAAERVSEAMAQIVVNYTQLKKSNLLGR